MNDVRLRVSIPAPKVRLRVLPSLLPTQIELRNTGTAVQWRYIDGVSDWVDLILIDDINAEVTIGTVTTLPAGSPATVTNVGTEQDVILDFGIPRGADGAIASVVAGSHITVDNTDPHNPIVATTGLQVFDATLTSIALLGTAADKLAYTTGIDTWAETPLTAAGRALIDDANAGAQKATLGLDIASLSLNVGDGINTIGTGLLAINLEVPWNCTITDWTILGDASGSIVFDVWKDSYANYPPVIGDSIVAAAKPTLSSATKAASSTLTGWTTTLVKGDVLRFNVDSITTLKNATLTLHVLKS